MQNICEVFGLSMDDMEEFFTCLSAIIMSSVCMGHFFFYGFVGFIDLIVDIVRAVSKLVVRHFPNVRKKTGE